jgi:Ca-activated chloride channel family protein
LGPTWEVALTGKVTDVDSGSPIQGAQISVQGENLGTLTDGSGEYTINFPDSWVGRRITVVIQHIGYTTTQKRVRLSDGSNTLDVPLAASTIALDALVVTASRAMAEGEPRMRAAAGFMYRQDLSGRFNPNFHTESYAHIQENVFLLAAANPLSTFSIDVDRASYANVRRFIHQGVRPPIDAVRIEELINYFPYGDRAPTDNVPLAIHTEVAPAPWQPLHRLVRVALKGRPVDMREAPNSNLVFLLDVSGSMNSPDKLPLLKTAFSMLVDQLRPQDRVAIVVYAGAAGLVLPSTPGSDKETILGAIQSLEAGGSTAGGAGIKLAYKVAAENHIQGGNNRVILATDGDFNIGVSSDSEMTRLIEDKRDQGRS